MQLVLKKFDPSKIPDDKVIVLIGSRGTGKTSAIKDILYYHRDIPIGTVISPTESANKSFGHLIPSFLIHDEYTPEIIANFLKRQKMIMKKLNKEKLMYGGSKIDPRAFLILDDCLYDKSWKTDTNIRYIFFNGRHQKILMFLTCQYVVGIGPEMRSNIDYVFIFRENNTQNRKRIYEQYAGIFPTFETFCEVMNVITEGYGCLVIDKTSKSNKLEENVFWYQAEVHEDFTIGSRELWQLHNEIANNDEDEEEDELFDINAYRKNSKKGPMLNIKRVH